jgi:hypothetical protein
VPGGLAAAGELHPERRHGMLTGRAALMVGPHAATPLTGAGGFYVSSASTPAML